MPILGRKRVRRVAAVGPVVPMRLCADSLKFPVLQRFLCGVRVMAIETH